MKKFGAGSESGQTDASRVALDRGGSTRKSWVPFHVRKELADQGENHTSIVSTVRTLTARFIWVSSRGFSKKDCHPEEGFSPRKDPQTSYLGKPNGIFSTRISHRDAACRVSGPRQSFIFVIVIPSEA